MLSGFRCLFLMLVVPLLFVGCESRDYNEFSLKQLEGDEGEAVVRYLIKNLPALDPDVPKVYTVVKGEHLFSTKTQFVRRMDDLKLSFVSGEVLTMMKDEDRSIIDPRSGLSPVTIQLTSIHKSGPNQWEVQAGWAYKKTYERRKLKLQKNDNGTYEVSNDEKVEGNYLPQS